MFGIKKNLKKVSQSECQHILVQLSAIVGSKRLARSEIYLTFMPFLAS